jgi:hypothetical protein
LAAAKATYVPQPGDIRYKDISGPNGVPDGKVDPTYDKTYLGSRIPKINYGFNFNLDYKGFDMALFLQGVAKVQGILNRNMGWGFYNTGSIQEWQITDSYNSDNPQRYPEYPRLEAGVEWFLPAHKKPATRLFFATEHRQEDWLGKIPHLCLR